MERYALCSVLTGTGSKPPESDLVFPLILKVILAVDNARFHQQREQCLTVSKVRLLLK